MTPGGVPDLPGAGERGAPVEAAPGEAPPGEARLGDAPLDGEAGRPAPAPGADDRLPPAYGPDSEAWRLNREAMLLLGAGPRALLMQLAHPLVAEGVDQHSGFRRDPWARLAGTLRSYLRIVYGTPAAARAEIGRLNELHRSINGPVRDEVARGVSGRSSYLARDPALSLWVHATLVDSTIVAYDAWLEPLTRSARARFYRETLPVGRAFGVPASELPSDLDAFERYLDGMLGPGGPVLVTPTARELASTILHPPLAPLAPPLAPLLGLIPPAAYDWTLWPSLELLPARLRQQYGIPRDPLRGAVVAWLLAGWRAWRPLIPTSLRWMPQARMADRRVARMADGPVAGTADRVAGAAGGRVAGPDGALG